jgi:uncharacterized membrane protein YedE/YeeE
MTEPNVVGGLGGGLLIGLAAVLLFAFNGRIAGVSGILGSIVSVEKFGERLWRVAFVLGLVAGGAVYSLIHGGLPLQLHTHGLTLAVAGLFVGFGTRLGSGCTSGHGVCGLARRSPRSLVATITFMLFGVITVYLTKQLF